MKILLTGSSGYIGTLLLPELILAGHEVYALTRSAKRLSIPESIRPYVQTITLDLLNQDTLSNIPEDIDIAFYLVHSMSQHDQQFDELEQKCALNFVNRLKETSCKQIIYLSGLVNDSHLSKHLRSRKNVENILVGSGIPYTVLRAGIIIGPGSASFEIIRDLVEKLPVMVAPRWIKSLCQPISAEDVLHYLIAVINNPKCLNETFDIGGPDILTYYDMMQGYAKARGLKRFIITVPVLTPHLSSLWLYFITSTNFTLAKSLVDSLKNEAICKDTRIQEIIPLHCLSYQESIEKALNVSHVLSSWKRAMVLSPLNPDLSEYRTIPTYGCVENVCEVPLTSSKDQVKNRLFSIGGERGWYFMDWAWELRGFIDKLVGGVGLRRGRRDSYELQEGDSLDFWRVITSDREKGVLLLYAEMKLPGEAWLEFQIKEHTLYQRAVFRPKGLLGRLYWYLLYPLHILIFKGMAKRIA